MDSEYTIEALDTYLKSLENAYWKDNLPLVTDEVYDALKKQYKDLTGGKDRPVGYTPVGRIPLPSPMYSLSNVYSKEEFDKWVKSIRKKTSDLGIYFIVQPKYDGCSITLHYKNKSLVNAYSRGNGKEGDIITDKLSDSLKNITLPSDLEIEIRGEIYITQSALEDINSLKKDDPYKTCRQAAAGILLGEDRKFKGHLSFVCFGAGIGGNVFYNDSDFLDNAILKDFSTADIFYKGPNASLAFETCENICNGEINDLDDIPMDGAVIKVDAIRSRELLGYTSHHPRWATAVKLQSNEIGTSISGVEWSVGIQGTITPTILIYPVTVGGVTVSRVTGDNASRFNAAKYRIGDTVCIKRAGDVIPKITKHFPMSEDTEVLQSPSACPACGEKTLFNGAYLTCGNGFMCEGNAVARMSHFVSRDALDLRGFGPKVLAWCKESEGITNGAMLLKYFRNPKNVTHIQKHLGEKTGLKLIEECNRKIYPLSKVLYSLAIPGVGLVTSQYLARAVRDMDTFIESFTQREAPTCPRVYDSICENIHYWIGIPDMWGCCSHLSELLVTYTEDEVADTPNQTVCFTGSGDGFDRKMLEQSAIRAGYKISKTVTRKVDYLVSGKTGSSTSKVRKAIIYKIPVISVPEWIKKTT